MPNRSFSFEKWEPIHTEYSFKYTYSDITKLAEETGFEITSNYTDSRKYFLDSLWRVNKGTK
jgi:L-histidine Nalpha-methyltransferase